MVEIPKQNEKNHSCHLDHVNEMAYWLNMNDVVGGFDLKNSPFGIVLICHVVSVHPIDSIKVEPLGCKLANFTKSHRKTESWEKF